MSFEETARRVSAAFDPVAERFGLVRRPYELHPREVTVAYEHDGVYLAVIASAGAAISVMVGATKGLKFGLHELGAALPSERDEEAALAALAKLTAEHAHEILSGDFSSFDPLRRARAVRVREDNQARWGTATGETPRFDRRPSLDELFADASNDGIRTARVYQAVWDYGYARDALAEYLEESSEGVERRLNDWDGLL